MSFDVGTAIGYLDLDTSGFKRGFKSALGDLETFSSKTTGISGKLTSLGSAFSSVGSSLTKGCTVPLVGLGTAAVATSASFESAMSEVQAISGATGKDLEDLKAKAQEMGATTKFSASESAAALKYMAMAGWDTESMLDGINGVMQLAAASGEDLATTSDIVTDAMTAFGLSADQSSRFADVLAMTANRSNTSVSLMGETFKYVAPVAGALGFSIEDTSVAIGLMANSGIKGSQAGTSLKNMLTNLAKPTDQVQGYMDKLNISLTDQAGKVKPLNQLLNEMRDSFNSLTDAEKAEYAAGIAGKEGMSGLLAIVNSSQEDFDKLTDSINNSTGAAQQVADVMQDNLGGQLTILKSTLEGVAISFGDLLLPLIKGLTEKLQALLTWVNNLSESQKEMIVKIAGVVAALGPALLIVGKLLTTVGKLPATLEAAKSAFGLLGKSLTSMKGLLFGVKDGCLITHSGITSVTGSAGLLSKAFTALASPVGIVVAAIAVLAAAFKHLWDTNEEFRDTILEIWSDIKDAFSEFTKGIIDRLNSLGFEFENITEVIFAVWNGFCQLLAPVFEGAFRYISNRLSTILNTILGVVDVFIAVFKGDWEAAWEAIKGIFKSTWEGLVDWFKTIGNTLLGILDVICTWCGTTWEDTWSGIKGFFVSIWDGIKSYAISTWTAITTGISNTLNTVKSSITTVWNGIKSFVTTTWNAIKSTATSVWINVKASIADPINAAKTLVSSAVSSIQTSISTGFNTAKNTVSNIFNSIKSSISDALSSAQTTVKNAIDKIKSFFDFSWSLPKLKLPHFSISGSFSINPPSVPSFSVSWYKNAMSGGMILNSATIFGFDPTTGKFLGGGEAGSETVVGTNNLMRMIRAAVGEAFAEIAQSLVVYLRNVFSNISNDLLYSVDWLVTASNQLVDACHELNYTTNKSFDTQLKSYEKATELGRNPDRGGDTYVFYSPKAIDEIEAAKRIKRTKLELAEGF